MKKKLFLLSILSYILFFNLYAFAFSVNDSIKLYEKNLADYYNGETWNYQECGLDAGLGGMYSDVQFTPADEPKGYQTGIMYYYDCKTGNTIQVYKTTSGISYAIWQDNTCITVNKCIYR